MAFWLTRWFRPARATALPAPIEDSALADEPPAWAAELLDLTKKSARGQVRLTMTVDDLKAQVEGGFSSLEAQAQAHSLVAGTAANPRWDDMLDAMDLLETVIVSPEAQATPALALGLRGVLARLGSVLEQNALERRAPRGSLPDGRLFRVVGIEMADDLPEGVISRVVRAAVLRGDQLIREGEVLTNRRMT